MTLPYVALCLPMQDEVKAEFCLSVFSLARTYHGLLSVAWGGASVVAHARNNCVDSALKLKPVPEFLLFIDSDMEFPPDTLHRLLRRDKNIVGAIYRRRSPNYEILGRDLGGNKIEEPRQGIEEMTRLPTGCLLIKTTVFEKFDKPYFRHPTDEGLGLVGAEDYEFSRMAKEKGFRLWCDHDLSREISHIGKTKYKYAA